jgi:hypothetical protein
MQLLPDHGEDAEIEAFVSRIHCSTRNNPISPASRPGLVVEAAERVEPVRAGAKSTSPTGDETVQHLRHLRLCRGTRGRRDHASSVRLVSLPSRSGVQCDGPSQVEHACREGSVSASFHPEHERGRWTEPRAVAIHSSVFARLHMVANLGAEP